jgi:hypothetical protein
MQATNASGSGTGTLTINGSSSVFPASVVSTGSQAAFNLPGTTGSGPSAGQPAYTSTASTFALPTGWSRTTTDIFNNGNAGSVSNSDWTGYTFWFTGASHVTLTNVLFTAPGANDDLLLNFDQNSTGELDLTNVTFDGNGITTRFYGFIIFLSGLAGATSLVKMRYCLFQNTPYGGPTISCPTDIQFCQFGPLSLKAGASDHTDLIFWHGATHTFSNNLCDYTMPAQNGQATIVTGCENWFADESVAATTVTFNNNICRGMASYKAASGGTSGVAYVWGGVAHFIVNNNAVEQAFFTYAGMNGGILTDGGNNRDYDTDNVLALTFP